MFDLKTPKQPSEDAIIVSNISKHFRIPHEKKTKLFEHLAGAIKGKVNGKIAPFLELGVGFNPELTAEDNVRLYGTIMGMSKKEMEDKFEVRGDV